MKCSKCQAENPDHVKFCSECGANITAASEAQSLITKTMETSREELTTGSTFAGRYQIIEELGKGGMGKVYKVLDNETGEKIALKLIKPEIASDKMIIERFCNELTTARRISHRNVCRMYDLNRDKENYFITMEFVSGGDLKKFIRRSKRLDLGTAISIAKQVCEGLGEAHNLGIVHRDLKSNNIMIDDYGSAKIMDFGIARSIKSKSMTDPGVMIGTPEYMSPEQVDGKEVDHRTDIYAMGVILYEMLTGQLPFEGDTPFTVGVKQKSETPEDPRKFNPGISEDLGRIILKCLEKEREGRYQSTAELCRDLDNIEKGLPTTDRVVPKHKPLTSREITVQFSLKKAVLPVVGVAVVVTALLFFWQPWKKKTTAPVSGDKPMLAVMYFKNNTGDKKYDFWRTSLSDSIIWDLNQSKYIEVLSADRLLSILKKLNLQDAEGYTTEELLGVAAEGRVKYILQGDLSKGGDLFRIAYSIQDISSGQVLGSERVEGQQEDSILPMVDQISLLVKRDLNLSREQISGDIDREVGEISTKSPAALKYYQEGVSANNRGEYDRGIELLKKAVEIDPEFAMAYRKLSVIYAYIQLYDDARESKELALKFADRLPEKERYLIQADYFNYAEQTYGQAIESYKQLLELYPDHQIGMNNLALMYSRIGERDKAIELNETLIRSQDAALITYTNLASLYMSKGWLEKAIGLLEGYIDENGDIVSVRRSLSYIYQLRGEYDLAHKELDQAFLLNPTDLFNIRDRGDLYLYQDEFAKVEIEYRKLLIHKPPLHFWGYNRLFWLYQFLGKLKGAKENIQKALEVAEEYEQDTWIPGALRYIAWCDELMGDYDAALEKYERIWELNKESQFLFRRRSALFDKAVVLIKLGRIEEAQKLAEKHRSMCEGSIIKGMILANYRLQAQIELAKGNYAAAIDLMDKILPPLSATANRFGDTYKLAEMYLKSGDLERARSEYEKMHTLTSGKFYYGYYYARSFYLLGKICQELGDTTKAREYFEKFLTMWKDADPELTELMDARKRVAELR